MSRIIKKGKTALASSILNILVVTLRSLRAATMNPVKSLRTE